MPKTPVRFAINHMTAPGLGYAALIELAAGLGCVGVEFRNDFAGKALFDGAKPSAVRKAAEAAGIRILALAEVKRFNDGSAAKLEEAARLIEIAAECGAERISLIPVNDASFQPAPAARKAELRRILSAIAPRLKDAKLRALVEPLGFPISSLRTKREAADAINDLGLADTYALVHDTFHHHLAGEREFFPELTGIVHISGVVDPAVRVEDMQDAHRVLVDELDRLGNIEQIEALRAAGYAGAYSYEPFAPSVHQDADIAGSLGRSIAYIRGRLTAAAA
jgi:2-keto-myo-inositol isomerase